MTGPRWPLGPLHAYAAAHHGVPVHTPGNCPGCLTRGAGGSVPSPEPACLSLKRLAPILGVTPRTITRWATHGLNDTHADQAAITLGTHPACIWPGWDEAALTDIDRVFVWGAPGAEPGWRPAALATSTAA